MNLIFCQDPLDERQPDSDYRAELEAAQASGLPTALIDFEALLAGAAPARIVGRVPQQPAETLALYRGWMLKPEQYQRLYDALLTRSLRLINDPQAYRFCHHLPENYPAIAPYTARSVWIPLVPGEVPDIDAVMALLAPFGDRPLILKDYVKSHKHHWVEACFIPSAADRATVDRVLTCFLELQGDDLNEGLVFREFLEFKPLGLHPQSGTPLTVEVRVFFLDHHPIAVVPQWDQIEAHAIEPPLDLFIPVAQSIPSRFFTMDLAHSVDENWLIIELGDGQVAGLPPRLDPVDFYSHLR